MTIEMSMPEELFPDLECVRISKGLQKVTIQELRTVLKKVLKNEEPIAVKDIEKVNTPFRKELMLKKTKELIALTITADPKDDHFHLMIDMFDYLALDWVYSDEVRWEGSLAHSYAQKIRDYLEPSK